MDLENFDPSVSKPHGDGGGDSGGGVPKKARVDFGCGSDMKRVAEIVMVLSAMGDMRGGRAPTAVERRLMNEAREKLAEMCEPVAPKDLFAREDVRVVVEDLGLNSKFRDQRLGFRPPKMSIAEKLLLTKRKMEESKGFTAPSAAYSSQLLQRGFGANANSEHHGSLFHAAHGFSLDKSSPMALSAGGFQPSAPAVNVSPPLATSSALLNQSQVNEVQPSITRVASSNRTLERDSSSLPLPRTEAAHFRLDAVSNGPAHVSQFRANFSGDHLLEKALTSSPMQFPNASVTKGGQANEMPDHSPINVEGAHVEGAPQTKRDKKPETSLGNLHKMHQPLPGMKFAQAPTLYTNHADIARNVQKILQPRVLAHPNWSPPSIDYMNSPLICQICKVTINDVESLLVCDACEKGAHLKCLHSYNQKGIPKTEWHCPKCLISSNGKPLPPKYGRVSRSTNVSKAPSTAAGVQASSEKKVEHPDQKVNHQKIIANGSPSLQKTSNARELHISNFPVSKTKLDDGAYSEASMEQSKERAGELHVLPSTQNESANKHLQNSELSVSDKDKSTLESESLPKVESGHLDRLSGKVIGILNPSQASCGSEENNDKPEVPICAKVTANQLHGNNTYQELQRHSDLRETSDYNLGRDVKRDDHGVAQAISNGPLDNMNGSRDCSKSSVDGLHSVDWVGDMLQVVDAKTYYPSCRIDGVLYKLKDHALFRSSNQILSPWKLQALWEDNKTKSKWAIVSQCYFPNELPEVVGRPCTPENNETPRRQN